MNAGKEIAGDRKRMWTMGDLGPGVFRNGLAGLQEVLQSLPSVSDVSFNTPERQQWAAHFRINLDDPAGFDVIRLLSLVFNRIERSGALPVLFRPVLVHYAFGDAIAWTLAPYVPLINPALVSRAIV